MRLTKRQTDRSGWHVILAAFLFLLAFGGKADADLIRDLKELSQNPLDYLDERTADTPLVPPREQAHLNDEYDMLYFAPWHRTEPYHSAELASWGFRKYAANPGYGKDGKPHPPDWIGKMAANAHLEDFPQGIFPAITVKETNFRYLPTHEFHSNRPKINRPGEPFDNMQESSAPAGMPVFVTLVSRDRKWFLAETNHLIGWVPSTDIAAVDQAFMNAWENGRYLAFVRYKTPIYDREKLLSRVPLGALYPEAGEDADRIWIWTAARDVHGKAVLQRASLAKEHVVQKPFPFTSRHVARLARELVGEPYGWGGQDGKRDCSALVRDLFAPFGLWLPRNSGDQADSGKFTSFAGLSSSEKEALIIREGVPWRTLLWTPGHIMLYIGVHKGKPLIFHNFWSVKTRAASGKRGRIVVGYAAITTLHPGRELPDQDYARADILYGLKGMILIGVPSEKVVPRPIKKPAAYDTQREGQR